MSDFKEDMSKANIAIHNKVLPVLKTYSKFSDCEFICLENLGNNIGDMFDINCGFDWFIKTNYGLYGLSARCQRTTKEKYQSFTLRKERPSGAKTEIQKRKDAIKHNCIYPYWTLQAYLVGDWDSELDYFGICKTKLIYDNLDKIETYPVNNDGVKFLVVNWSELKKINVTVLVHKNKE